MKTHGLNGRGKECWRNVIFVSLVQYECHKLLTERYVNKPNVLVYTCNPDAFVAEF